LNVRRQLAELRENKKEKINHEREAPPAVVPKPNAIVNFFYEWQSSDGETHKTYEQYSEHQKILLNRWELKSNKIENENKTLTAESELIKDVKKDGQSYERDPINRLLKLENEQKIRRPKLFEKIQETAAALLQSAKQFFAYRTLKKLQSEVTADLKIVSDERIARNRLDPDVPGPHW